MRFLLAEQLHGLLADPRWTALLPGAGQAGTGASTPQAM